MKKKLWVILCITFIPAAALAQDTMLYDMSDTMLTLAEATLSCIAAGNECSEAEALALKFDAEQELHDLVSLLMSGNISRMKLTGGQSAALRAKLAGLRGQLVHTSGLLQGVCNYGIAMFNYALGVLGYAAMFGFIGLGTLLLVLSLLILIPGCLLMLTCPLWWL